MLEIGVRVMFKNLVYSFGGGKLSAKRRWPYRGKGDRGSLETSNKRFLYKTEKNTGKGGDKCENAENVRG